MRVKAGLSDSADYWLNGIAKKRRDQPVVRQSDYLTDVECGCDVKINNHDDETIQVTPLDIYFRVDDKMHGDDQTAASIR